MPSHLLSGDDNDGDNSGRVGGSARDDGAGAVGNSLLLRRSMSVRNQGLIRLQIVYEEGEGMGGQTSIVVVVGRKEEGKGEEEADERSTW
jgi:hypothetical protein